MPKLKRLSVPWTKKKKSRKFVIAPRGPHRLDSSLPLAVVIRDVLKIAETGNEARNIIKGRNVKVDGIIRKDPRFGVGLFDVIEVGGRAYRAIPRKGLGIVEIPGGEASKKLCKITSKTAIRKGKIQLNLHDGKNIVLDKNQYSARDSLVVDLPSQKILDHVKFEPDVTVMIISGKHMGKTAKLKKIEPGLVKRVWLEREGKLSEAPLDAVMAVGKEASLINLGE